METTRPDRISVGERLPAVTLEPVAGQPLDLRRTPHESSVLVFVHPGCGDCRAYLEGLEGWAERLRAWGGQVLVVVESRAAARTMTRVVSSTVLCDPDGGARVGTGLAADEAAVIVADKFGTVYRVVSTGGGHDLPEPGELLEEIRYLGSQCPECGVPDDPLSGEEAWHRAG